jgi:hypothetical protein
VLLLQTGDGSRPAASPTHYFICSVPGHGRSARPIDGTASVELGCLARELRRVSEQCCSTLPLLQSCFLWPWPLRASTKKHSPPRAPRHGQRRRTSSQHHQASVLDHGVSFLEQNGTKPSNHGSRRPRRSYLCYHYLLGFFNLKKTFKISSCTLFMVHLQS